MLHDTEFEEIYRTYLSPLVYWSTLCCLAYTGHFWSMFFFFFFGATLITSPEDVQEEDLFVDEDETEAYHHTMMEFEMFREYFDDYTGMTLGEWSGVEIMPIDLDELLDSVTEDPLIIVPRSFDIFLRDSYNSLISMYDIVKSKPCVHDIFEYYWRDDYMPHTLYRYTTQRMHYVDYHDIYQRTKNWDKVKSEWKEISEEESYKTYHNSLLMASVLDQGLHGFREYDFYSFHQYDYTEIFYLFDNIEAILYLEDLDEWEKDIESLKQEGEWGQFHMPESHEKTQHYLDHEDETYHMEELIYHMENGFIPNLAHKDLDDDFFDNHLVWEDPYTDGKYLYTKHMFFSNINISYINISYSPVLSILHCKKDDAEKQQVLRAYYDGVF